ncbi:MAG: 23S rRNA (guanosine(2251)-2'-O)-methyltransferase RlmB [Hyphomicrobiaceae bacterium]|nr:23S rRNA (guanosine(2251)-2'-O)-methyltransferase RlmB [Hyphomicrobiaceae bacterium]
MEWSGMWAGLAAVRPVLQAHACLLAGTASPPLQQLSAGAASAIMHNDEASGSRPRGHADRRKRRDNQGGRSPGAPRTASSDTVELYGLHAVAAALGNSERRVLEMYVTENAERRLAEAIGARAIVTERVSPRDLDRRLGADTVHQGALLVAAPLPEPPFEALAESAHDGHPLIVLDQVTDPHNVGAILRSAAVFGCGGLIMTRRHSPPLNGTLAKSASGALELVPVHLTQNLGRALAALAEAGILTVGLDGTAETSLGEAPLSGAIALVLGAEGKGLRQSSREACAHVVRIEAAGALTSLNVSNAAAIALYAAAAARRGA